MASLIFPQLSSGAMVQYPIRKQSMIRTIKNLLADGSMFVDADPGAGQIIWTLTYANLPAADMQALQGHFVACAGPLRAFMFLDPTDNLLSYSADLSQSCWVAPSGVTITPGVADPLGGINAFTATNSTAVTQQITQTLSIPASFQYCFSIYASSNSTASCMLNRESENASDVETYQLSQAWSRIASSGALADQSNGFTVGIGLAPGQSLSLFGPQLEPQFEPSRYRATYSDSGVYLNAHWGVSELAFRAQGPNLFSTSFEIETSIWS